MKVSEKISRAIRNKDTSIDLSDSSLDHIPESLIDLYFIKRIDLSNNSISDISILRDFISVVEIDLSNNHIRDIKPLSGLVGLKSLNISSNEIQDIGDLAYLNNLEFLDLSNNRVQDIEALKGLTRLENLDFSRNKIQSAGALGNLTNLESIDISGNQISIIENIIQLPRLKRISLQGNPISILPEEIQGLGIEPIRNYFAVINSRETVELSEVKLTVLGDGGSGKTSIVNRLIYDSFDFTSKSTHGINVDSWIINEDDEEIKASIWDFGGQEIMHATHQFFLTERSVFLLVVDSRKEGSIDYWLNTIQLYGGNSPIIVVLNKIDENPIFDLNRKYLHERYPNIVSFVRTSCITNQGIGELKRKIIETYNQAPFRHLVFPLGWYQTREALSGHPENYLLLEDYYSIARNYGLSDRNEQSLLLVLLNDLGTVISFDEVHLKDIIILNPHWLTNAVYRIVNSKLVFVRNGLLAKNDIRELFSDDSNEYPAHLLGFIVDVMSEFELIYKLQNNSILIPDLLPVAEPDFSFDFDTSLQFIIEYKFLPKSFASRLIIALYDDVLPGKSWRMGMLIKNPLFSSVALIRVDESDRVVQIFVNGEQPRSYLNMIRNEIRRINSNYKNLEAKEKVPIPDFKGVSVSYDHLLLLEENYIERILPDGADKMFDVKSLLEGVRPDQELPSQEEVTDILDQIVAGKKSVIISKKPSEDES